jgi:hypothetical protein
MKSFLVVHIAQETSITIFVENGKEISDLKLEMTYRTAKRFPNNKTTKREAQ